MLVIGVLPFIGAMVALAFWSLLYIIKPQRFRTTYIRNAWTTTFVFIFLMYPTITSNTFGMFNCKQVEGVYYLSNDYEVVCWDSAHM